MDIPSLPLANFVNKMIKVLSGEDLLALNKQLQTGKLLQGEIINFLREYYEEYQIAPAVRVLTKAVGKKLGKDKGNSKYLYELFPYGPGKQACKFAGLPKPTGCV